MPNSTLFFDLDGTLMINPFGGEIFPRLTSQMAMAAGITPQAAKTAIMAEYQRRRSAPHYPNAAWVMDWDDIIQTTCHTLKIPDGLIAPNACHLLVKQFASPPHTQTLDDAVSVLRQLRMENTERRLVVSTMGLSKYQLPVLHALDLQGCFDAFLMPDLAGFLKHEAGFFANEIRPDGHHISIGDNYIHDVIFPKSLGFRSILRLPEKSLAKIDPFARPQMLAPFSANIQEYPDQATDIAPDAVVVHLNELPAVLRQLEETWL
jgi:putative hydrolase of the HAD superfamily